MVKVWKASRMLLVFVGAAIAALSFLAACGTREVVKEVPVEVVVEKEVIKEVEVPVVVREQVIKEVPVEVVVEREVIREVEVPIEVVVEREVIREVEVPVVVKEVEIREIEKIVEVERPAEEKVLRVRMANMPPTFQFQTVGSGALTIIEGWMFSSLVQVGPQNGVWAPNLAAAWEISEDATEWTFFLQKHATWHDGEPVTAQDVAFSVKKYLHPQQSGWMLRNWIAVKGGQDFQDGKTDEVAGIEVIDDYTIKFTLEAPNVTFLDEIGGWNGGATPVMPAHILKDIPDDQFFEHEYWSKSLIGSGAFKFVEYVPQQYMEVEANDDFFFGRPKIDRIIFVIIGSADATQIAMQRGEIDVTLRGGLSLAANKEFLADPRFDVFATQAGLIVGYAWNGRIEHLQDPRVREAFWIGQDEKRLCESFHGGLCTTYGSFLVQDWVYKPEWDTRFPFNPDRARQLLSEAGWDPNRVITTETRPITDANQRAELAVRQQMLGEAGIKYEIKEVDAAAGQSKWYDTLDAEVVRHGSSTRTDPALKMTEWFSDGENDPFGMYVLKPDFFDGVLKGAALVNLDERAAYFRQFNEEVLWKLLPMTNINQYAQVKVKSKRFYMPILGEIPKVNQFRNLPIFPIHANRDDNWVYHAEQWDIRQ